MAQAEQSIAAQAGDLRAKLRGPRPDPRPLWLGGEYTEYNRERN